MIIHPTLTYKSSKSHERGRMCWNISALTRQNCSRLHGKSFPGFIYAFVRTLKISKAKWNCN